AASIWITLQVLFPALAQWITEQTGQAAWYQDIARYGLYVVGLVALMAVAFALAFLLFSILMGPFKTRLAARVFDESGMPDETTPRSVFRAALHDILMEVKRLLVIIAAYLLVWTLSFIPGMGSVLSLLLSFLLSIFVFAYEFLDYGMERQQLSLAARIRRLFSRPFLTAGFGLACIPLLIVPFMNVATILACVIGGALLYQKYFSQTVSESRYES
ncbi:MAG: EI24 domain-containing protein, partial [Chlorobi bacterium]|nr:EI24 domain-containing protein [Chlorobiota bacterium]